MEFCAKCGGLMIPKKSGSRVVLICRRCGKKKSSKEKKFKIKISTEKLNKSASQLNEKIMSEIIEIERQESKSKSEMDTQYI